MDIASRMAQSLYDLTLLIKPAFTQQNALALVDEYNRVPLQQLPSSGAMKVLLAAMANCMTRLASDLQPKLSDLEHAQALLVEYRSLTASPVA